MLPQWIWIATLALSLLIGDWSHSAEEVQDFDVVVVGGTPGGIMAAIAAARNGKTVALLDRNRHIGGLPANGLGATDIATRGATGGLFLEFVGRVRKYYVDTYGANSQQVKDCSDGHHFEPHVAENIFKQMLGEHKKIKILRRQFDALPENVVLVQGSLTQITVVHPDKKETKEKYSAKVFVDATYEGDLAAAAGVPYRLGREDQRELNEPMAGRLYKRWGGKVGNGSTGLGDNAIQAYNFRLCLTRNKNNMVPIPKPANYNRKEYLGLIDDVKLNRTTGRHRREMAWEGIGRITNMVRLPNGGTDANNQHLAFLSTDLPEENWPWPTSGWDWRDRFARRLKDYTLGLLWFAQHDPDLPEDFRKNCLEWGFAKTEYADNEHFPRQVYVREGRRIMGEHLFTAHDAIPKKSGSRPPVYTNSITSSHYNLDSHAVRKREPGRVHLDGFFSYPTSPYTVPYGVIVPKKVDGLLIPVPVSGTHIGFSTLRMEPCWMALGEAAGEAAHLSIEEKVPVRKVPVSTLQKRLLKHGASLIYFKDARPKDPHFQALQYFAVRGSLGPDSWKANLKEIVSDNQAKLWIVQAQVGIPESYRKGKTTRGELLSALFRKR